MNSGAPDNDPRVQRLRKAVVNRTPGARQVMAFDFGSRRIGVAVGHERIHSAAPLPPIPACDGIPSDWGLITLLLMEWLPDVLVVGLPLNADGSESLMSKRARKFGNRLYGRYARPVEWVNEYGSTQTAKLVARGRGRREGSYHDDGVDSIAAEIILSRFFSAQ